MNPEVIISLLSTAIAALFGALMFSMRQQREDWKELFQQEKKDHNDTRKSAAEEARENANSIKELSEFLHELPRRREDWAGRREATK